METNNSQEFADYFNECLIIDQTKSSDESFDEDHSKHSPNNESILEAEWLRNAGFQSIVAIVEAGKDVDDDQFSPFFLSLTHRQANAVKKRITTLKTTVRKRKLPRSKIRDVREVFPPRSESSSGGTRSRSATPDSLDSISPSDSPPTPNEWLLNEGIRTGSPTPSQGYFSNTRSSPDMIDSPSTNRVSKTSNFSDGSPRSPGDGCNSPDIVDREPEFTQIFKAPFDGLLTRKDEPNERKHRSDSFMKNKTHSAYDVSLLRPHKQWYDFSSTGTLLSDTGIEVLDYQPKGSLCLHPGKSGLSQSLLSGLSESDISLEIRDEPDVNQSDFDWGFERRHGMESDDDLPDMFQVGGRVGVTQIDDLGEEDLRKIRKLALIELTALFDANNIQFSGRKGMKKKKRDNENSVFGVALTTLIEQDKKIQPDCKIPLVLKRILNHLEKHGLHEEGILRVPGGVNKIQYLKLEIEKHFYSSPGLVDEALKKHSVNDVAALVKQFFRELPIPLLTYQYMDAFYKVDYIPDKVEQIKALKLLVFQLPEVHRETLKSLFDFLSKVVAHESENRMSLQNVSMIIAPNLFLPKKRKRNAERNLGIEINLAAITCKITKMMIKYRELLWTVPNFLVQQIRRQNEAVMYRKENGHRNVKKFLGKPKKTEIHRKINNEVDFQEGVIRVDAKQFGKEHFRVQLNDLTTPRDVIYEVTRDTEKELKTKNRRALREIIANQYPHCLESNSIENHCLYEIGGNIDERCLDHNANMIAVYQQNPNTKWEIRCKHLTNHLFTEELI